MKTTMKLFTYGLMIFAFLFTACSKDGEDGTNGLDGTNGINGINGADGVDGTDGIDGADGNANVSLIEYGAETFTSTITYPITGVSLTDTENSIILGFYAVITQEPNAGNSFVTEKKWIPIPGRGHSPLFETRGIIETNNANLTANTPNTMFKVELYEYGSLSVYTTEVTFDGFKIFVIPASEIVTPTTGPVVSGKTNNVDYRQMSYSELVAHFGLEK